MERRALGRDFGLSIRMTVALMFLAATYVGLAALCVVLVEYRMSYAWLWILAGAVILLTVAGRYGRGGDAVLRSLGAEVVPAGEEHSLHAVVERLAGLADIAPPRLAIAETDAPNALAVGLRQRSSTIVLTRGLIDLLEVAETESVVAHEIAHLAHRDAGVMTAVSVPRTIGEVVVGEAGTARGMVWIVGWPLGLIPLGIGTVLTLTVSRYREFSADRGSAVLTGQPEQLMSALQKIAGHAAEIPHEDLRAANAFCIVSTGAQRISLFSDHPPLEKRLAALSAIAREMGRPVA
jgi:heat shock protein HtpX